MQESVIYRSIQEEAEARGEARAEARKQREIAVNLLSNGVTLEIIASATGLSVEQVEQLQQQISELPPS